MRERTGYRDTYDLRQRPDVLSSNRNVSDVVHSVAAVGSRSVESAQKFIQEYAGGGENIKAYGSYDEVFADPVSLTATLSSRRVDGADAAW